jgi:hypothetical protein
LKFPSAIYALVAFVLATGSFEPASAFGHFGIDRREDRLSVEGEPPPTLLKS